MQMAVAAAMLLHGMATQARGSGNAHGPHWPVRRPGSAPAAGLAGRAHHRRRDVVQGSLALPALAAIAAGDEPAGGGPRAWAPVASALHRWLPRRMAARFLQDVDAVTVAVASDAGADAAADADATLRLQMWCRAVLFRIVVSFCCAVLCRAALYNISLHVAAVDVRLWMRERMHQHLGPVLRHPQWLAPGGEGQGSRQVGAVLNVIRLRYLLYLACQEELPVRGEDCARRNIPSPSLLLGVGLKQLPASCSQGLMPHFQCALHALAGSFFHLARLRVEWQVIGGVYLLHYITHVLCLSCRPFFAISSPISNHCPS